MAEGNEGRAWQRICRSVHDLGDVVGAKLLAVHWAVQSTGTVALYQHALKETTRLEFVHGGDCLRAKGTSKYSSSVPRFKEMHKLGSCII